MLSRTALGGIWVYQRYISPHKGYRCAYSVHHGGTGCSGYVKHAIREYGLWKALPQIRARFRACKDASAALREDCPIHRSDSSDRRRRERRKDRWWFFGEACGYGMCGACSGAAGAQPTSTPDGTSDTSSGSCGDGMDCSVPDCTPDCSPGCDCSPSC